MGVANTRRSSHVSARAAFLPVFGVLLHAPPRRLKEIDLMITKHILQVFGEFAFRFISKKVNVLTTRCGYSKSDRADLYQDFATNLIARSAKYDPNAANWEGFVVVVCENHFADILARRFAEKRNCQREKFSLNASVIDRGGKRRGRSGKVEEHTSLQAHRETIPIATGSVGYIRRRSVNGHKTHGLPACPMHKANARRCFSGIARIRRVPRCRHQGNQLYTRAIRTGRFARLSVIFNDNSVCESVG